MDSSWGNLCRSASNRLLFYRGVGLQNSVNQDLTEDLFQGDFLKFDLQVMTCGVRTRLR